MQDISECLSLEAQNVAEARLAAKRAARAEAREIRMKELERQQKEVEERSDKDFGEKDSLAEVEEKYKRSMVTNAQLDNEKTSLQYQVDTLREVLLEFEEELAESRRQYEDKHKECERQKHDQNILHFKLAEMKEALEQRESLLTKHGIALDSVGTPNGDASVEPHVNADGRPDPPIRATSMGPSEEAVEKKETMSVVGEIPSSKTEQANQEVLLTASSESPLNAEVGDEMKEQIIQEFAHNSNDVNTVGTVSGCQTDLEHHGALSLDSASTSNECEKAVDEHAPENVHKENLELRFSEMPKETTVDQRNTSPVEYDVFQDALENVVQSPLVADQFSEEYAVSTGDFRSDDYNFTQQDLNKEEDQCVQSTSIESNSVPKNGTLEISDCKDNVVVITDDVGDLHKDTKDEHETSSSDDSSKDDSEGSTADEMTATGVKHEVCEEEVKHEEQSVLVESGLESREDDSEKKDSNTNDISSEKESVSAEATVHTDAYDVAEKKSTDESPEQSTQDIQLIKEDKQLVDRENNNYGEVSEPCVISNMQSAVKNEVLKKIEDDSISHLDQHKGTTDDGSIHANLGSQKNGKINTAFPDIPGPELLDKREENTFPDTLVYDESERSNKKMNTIFSDAPDTVVLDEGNLDKISDHPVCDKSKTINEITYLVFPDMLGTELLEEEKQDKTSDHPDGSSSSENTIDNIPVVTETQKDSVSSETVSSEGECTPEGEESDDNEDVAVRSEKYTGESLPLGSSVDHGSTDDIRMEDSSDKAVRKGKGKNKEDCVVS